MKDTTCKTCGLRFMLLTLILCSCGTVRAQQVALHNNILYDIGKALSLGTEVAVGKHSTLELYGSIRPWKETTNEINKHWLAQLQYRYYTCQKYNGFYFGPYVHGGEFNVENATFPFGALKCLNGARYEGWLAGAGIGVGYEFVITKHLNLGLEVGGGYTRIDYKQFDCGVCGNLSKEDHLDYWGISKLGANIIFLF